MDTLVRVQIDKFRTGVRMLAELEELVWKTKEVNGGADVIVKKDGIEEIRDACPETKVGVEVTEEDRFVGENGVDTVVIKDKEVATFVITKMGISDTERIIV